MHPNSELLFSTPLAMATENVSLNFAKVEFQYTVQTEKGGAGAKPKMQWDIKKGKGSVS